VPLRQAVLSLATVLSAFALFAPAEAGLISNAATDPATGVSLDLAAMDSAPPEFARYATSSPTPEFMMASKTLSGVHPAMWWYGCSATSAGMLFSYYDGAGVYTNMYSGTITGNLDGAELDLIATGQHITDYYTGYGNAGPDPGDHAYTTCTADFMGTRQWKWDKDGGGIDYNKDGETKFWFWSGGRLYDYIQPAAYGLPQTSGCHGLRLFAESRGYQVAYENGNYMDYNQYVDTYAPGQFSYADYMAEIDAGHPVLIHVEGHTMLGYGYNNDASNQVVLYDTWDYLSHSMTWGGTYSGLQHYGVTVLHLAAVPEPATLALLLPGLAALLLRRRRA